MPLRVSLTGQPTLAQLCHDLKVVANDAHLDNELRANGRSLYIKLRSASCAWRRESARLAHRGRAVALVRERFVAALDELGVGFMKDQLLAEFLPGAGGGRPAPVRVRDVLVLEELVSHTRRLATRLSGPVAVMQAISQARQARQALGPREAAPVPSVQPELPVLPVLAKQATQASTFEQRASHFLAEAEAVAQAGRIAAPRAQPPGPPPGRRPVPERSWSMATSFTSGELVTAAEQRRLDHFMERAGPLIDKVTPSWRSMQPQQQLEAVEQLVRQHQASYGYGAVEVHFDGDVHAVARLSANGVHLTLPIARADVTRNFDEFVHLIIYGLALRHQHELAMHLPAVAAEDLALARIMRASHLVPMDKQVLASEFGMRAAAAREAWASSASHRHATALADAVAARAYAALPDDASRLPPMALIGLARLQSSNGLGNRPKWVG